MCRNRELHVGQQLWILSIRHQEQRTTSGKQDIEADVEALAGRVHHATDFFYFEHIAKYQGDVEGETRIKMTEMWVPAAAITEPLKRADDAEAKA